MATAVFITSRPIQNVHTALDLWVPEYQEIRGKMMTGHVEYQIVVVTTIAAFKSAKHKPEDVVQFVVSRKYSEIEDFYQKICSNYSNVTLPPFPRKVLFVGEADIRERRVAFNKIVQAIAKERQLATSPELLDFLGLNSSDPVDQKWEKYCPYQIEEGDFFKQEPLEEPKLHIGSNPAETLDEEEEDEEVDLDPLGILKTKKEKKPKETNKTEVPKLNPKSTLGLFDDEADPDEGLFEPTNNSITSTKKPSLSSFDIKLFEEQDLGGTVKLGDCLLIPSDCKTDNVYKVSSGDDVEDLFRVEDDFEKLLNLELKPKKLKPPLPQKPSLPKESSVFPLPPTRMEPNVHVMDESDILKYIKDNEPADSDSLSLF